MKQLSFKVIPQPSTSHLFYATAALIVIFAFLVRWMRASYGLPYTYYWDEPQIASTALHMLKSGDLNPHFFNYGSFLINLDFFVDFQHALDLFGRPEKAREYLQYLSDIQTNNETGWYWSISHPSFYYVNRIVNVIFGTGTIILTYFLAKTVLGGRWIALTAAALVAVVDIHVEYSALITPDVPVAFLTTGAVLFSLIFVDSGTALSLTSALVFCGLAAATKYDGALVMVAPATAVLLRLTSYGRERFDRRWLAMLVLVPAVTFAVAMPYAFLDIPNFLTGLGVEIRHYKVLGHPGAESRPGIGNIIFQLKNFYENLGPIYAAIIIIGLIGLRNNRKLLIALLFPTIFFFYMTNMKVNFHRNFLVLYPFLGLLFAAGCAVILNLAERLPEQRQFRRVGISAFATLLVGLLCWSACKVWIASVDQYRFVDSRSEAVSLLRKTHDIDQVIIAKDIRVHEDDLRRLGKAYTITDVQMLSACDSSGQNSVIVLPEEVSSNVSTPEFTDKEAKYTTLVSGLDKSAVLAHFGLRALNLDIPSNSPRLVIARLRACGKA